MKRVTLGEAPCRERQTADETMLDERESDVLGARRREPTCLRQQRRDEPLIADDGAGCDSRERAHTSLGPGIAASACRI